MDTIPYMLVLIHRLDVALKTKHCCEVEEIINHIEELRSNVGNIINNSDKEYCTLTHLYMGIILSKMELLVQMKREDMCSFSSI